MKRVVVACIATLLALPAYAVDIALSSAWMRPADPGEAASAYVDIRSDAPLQLVGASTPLARKVEIVVVERTDGTDPGKVVKVLAVPAGAPLRLAYKGSHLRLVGVKKPLVNGTPVPVTLRFRDKAGKRYTAVADVQVHGLVHVPGGVN
ncbi:MAG TPA: copper chaperone PCu(A)C [Casimicrobiaceae bacterium]|jgi:copper(I)-binding protein|nr:copper chaperone PCu(A)C [Casimicrobiaceae bacterium]